MNSIALLGVVLLVIAEAIGAGELGGARYPVDVQERRAARVSGPAPAASLGPPMP